MEQIILKIKNTNKIIKKENVGWRINHHHNHQWFIGICPALWLCQGEVHQPTLKRNKQMKKRKKKPSKQHKLSPGSWTRFFSPNQIQIHCSFNYFVLILKTFKHLQKKKVHRKRAPILHPFLFFLCFFPCTEAFCKSCFVLKRIKIVLISLILLPETTPKFLRT